MLLTPHVFVGLTLASSIPNPFVSVPMAFVMHFLGDKVPHWDFFSNTKMEERLKGWRIFAVIGDIMLGLAVGLTATYFALWKLNDSKLALNFLLCSFASVLPDALEAPHLFFGFNDPFTRALLFVQHKMQFQAKLPWGIISQIVVILACLALLLNLLPQA